MSSDQAGQVSGSVDTAFDGQLVRRGEDGYEDARVSRVFNNRRPDRFPAAVLFAANEQDVVRGVRLARAEGLRVSVRSGGHSWAAWSVRDDALLIDLIQMRSIEYDPATGVAIVNPAVRGGFDLTPFLSARGRAFPGGGCPSVGLGGFLLQGGQGWNSRAVGWGCENVVAVDVVTADGEALHCDEHENSDLYWAARGAGPGFPAIVTRFHLQTYPKPPAMMHDTWAFRLEDAEPLLEWMHAVLPTLHVTVQPVIAATTYADVPLDPGKTRPEGTVLLLHTTVMADSIDEASERLAVFDTCPLSERRLGHVRGTTSVEGIMTAQAPMNPNDHRYAVDCTWTNASAKELAPLLREMWAELPGYPSYSIWYGWAPTRPLPDMAFSIEANVYLATTIIYSDPADDERHREWVHGRTRGLATKGVGAYLGDTDFTRRTDRFVSDANYARLEDIRAVRDPDRLICGYLVDDESKLNQHA